MKLIIVFVEEYHNEIYYSPKVYAIAKTKKGQDYLIRYICDSIH